METALIERIIGSLQNDVATARQIQIDAKKDEKDLPSKMLILDDFETIYSYIVREANLNGDDVIDLYYKILKSGDPALNRAKAAQKLKARCIADMFHTLDDNYIPGAIENIRSYSGKLSFIKSEFPRAAETMAKKYLLLLIELGKYFEDNKFVKNSVEKYTDFLQGNYSFKEVLGYGLSGRYDYNEKMTYQDLLATIGDATTDVPIDGNAETALKAQVLAQRKAELANLIGLEEAKAVLTDEFFSSVLARQIMKTQYSIEPDMDIPHIILAGNPGVGKTTLGKIVADLLWAYGVLPERKFSRLTRSDLVGQYVGWTEHIVKNKLTGLLGGVILIDEAHKLYAAEDDSRDFTNHVVGELNNFLEEHKNECVVILAGYKKGILKLLSMDDGLASRFSLQLDLPDYSSDQLKDIFNNKAQTYGIKLATPDLIEDIVTFLEKKKVKIHESFANGREVRNLAGLFRSAVHARLYRDGKLPSQPEIAAGAKPPSLEELQTITAAEVGAILKRESLRLVL